MVRRIIQTISNEDVEKPFLLRAEKVILFLKSKFPKHATKDGENISFHKLDYGLCGKHYTENSVHSCSDCQIPFKFFHDMKLFVHENHHVLLDDCRSKVLLFMGHILRVTNQRLAISNELEALQTKTLVVYIVIDYKMKMLPVYFREKMLEHYGKKGMSWHGAMLYMKQTCEDDDDREKLADLLTTYYDHISDGDSKQDWVAVVSICEAILCRIEKDYPHIEEVVLQSDNARCYQNSNLLCGLMLICKSRHKLKIAKFIHSETQDGKCSIDAPFCCCNGSHHAVCKRRKQCYFPSAINSCTFR